MNVLNLVRDAFQYVSEAVVRIFKPANDDYPETGVQPFEGEPFSKWVDRPPTETKSNH
jgi:hypothetical protein